MNSKNKKIETLSPIWMFYALIAAGLYNLLWGGIVILFPNLFFDWANMPRPIYPEIWQCVGMIVGVYGIGYLIAAFDPLRFWPIVLVGVLGKIFGPIGFLQALWLERFSIAFGWNIVFNDLVWWVPFFLILKWSFRELQKPKSNLNPIDPSELIRREVIENLSLQKMSEQNSIALIFLRHFGCSFCRDFLAEVRSKMQTDPEILERLIFVHMSDEDRGREFFEAQGLGSANLIADPDQLWYQSFGLPRSSWGDLISMRLLWRGFRAAVLRRRGLGRLEGDGFQMPGFVVIENSEIQSKVSFSDFSKEFSLRLVLSHLKGAGENYINLQPTF
jgi:hypothetical protein